MNETELAAAVAAGTVPSPAKCGGFWLVAMRITGTGTAYRAALDEHVFRPPENYLTPEFLSRCNGLPIIANHPDGALNGAEYEARVLGSIVFPYIANSDGVQDASGDEVWGVGRVYSDEVVEAITADPSNPLSTSPMVVFRHADESERLQMADGSVVLIEGTPSLLCHVAICDQGVWDKGFRAHGIRADSETGREFVMTTEEIAADAERARKDGEDTKGNIDKILKHLDDFSARMDAIGKRLDAVEKPDPKIESAEPRARKDLQTREHGTPWNAADADRERQQDYENIDAQCRADAVYQAFGTRTPPPMQGEKPIAYRRRVLRPLLRHSAVFKDCDLDVVSSDPKTMAAVETIVFADAMKASRCPVHPEGFIEKRVRTLESGHKVTEFYGNPTIFKQMSSPVKAVTRFLTPQLRGDNL